MPPRSTPGHGRRPRTTIGVLVGFPVYENFSPNTFASAILQGMKNAARARGVNLLVACGVGRGSGPLQEIRPAWPDPAKDVDFVPVGPWNTDGLLVLNPLRSEARLGYLRQLAGAGFPVLSVGTGGVSPSIVVDNEGGILACMQHLAGHGHRAIAFIAGDDEAAGDSRSRIDAFRAGQEHLALDRDPRLITHGRHWQRGGHDAMTEIVASGVHFTAVMCSNDASAIGAIAALRERNIRVPADVAVTGFDDQAAAATLSPPLTTVHYPLAETGERAVTLLDESLETGRPLPDIVQISTRLMLRQSCGCPDLGDRDGTEESAVGARSNALEDSLRRTLASDDPASFLRDLTNLLQEDELAERDIHSWQSDLTALVSRLPVIVSALSLSGQAAPAKAEELLHRARALVSASVQRQGARSVLAKGRQGERLGRLSSRLISSILESDMLAALAEELPSVEIRGCHIFYFDGPDTSDCRTAPGEKPGLRFASRSFPPPGLYPPGAALCLDLLPLSVQDETLGYAAFDAESPDSLALVAGQLSAAVKTARLHAEVRSLSLTDALTGVANRRHFDSTLQREFERCQRYSRVISVILADVDLFKSYNDQCGHPAGDDALREIARCFLKATRKEVDVVCRYGGEEFAVILPETNTAGARRVAERIREEVLHGRGFLKPLSVSLGVASISARSVSRDLLLEAADRALYAAKNGGRNRVEVGEDPD